MAPSAESTERERTWLVRRLPDPLPDGTPIAQGYLALDAGVAVRVRRKGDHHVTTIKGGRGRQRVEVECEISIEQFDALWPLTADRRVDKVRHEVPVDGGTAELDVFAGALEGLVLVEVEFDDAEAMEAFRAPDWFGPEVSDDDRYTNAALATGGIPDDHPGGYPEREPR